MVLVVESGAADPRANAYIELAWADDYHLDRGNSAWAVATQAAKEAAIIKGTMFLDARYLNRWRGKKKWPLERSRSWPRIPDLISTAPALIAVGLATADVEYTFSADTVPLPIMEATAEAALRALKGDLMPDLDRGGRIVSQSVNLGGLSRSTTFSPGAPPGTTFALIDGIVAPLVARSAMMRGVARA